MKKLTLLTSLLIASSFALAENKTATHEHKSENSHNQHKSHGHHKHHHEHHSDHSHIHKDKCGHKAEEHDDHVDFEHGKHHHHQKDGHTHDCEGPHKDTKKP